jgi:hypothetical protein
METPPMPTPNSSAPPSTSVASGQDALRSINCTKCGAPITLHGGHRVLSITCAYCGSELDAKDDFKVLHQFNSRERPVTPIEIGMSGEFKGIEFTVIGLIQFRSLDGYGWIEFALFSPTHGYAWLEQSGNHFLFSRRTRDIPSTPMGAQVKSSFKVRDRQYRVYESFKASIVYVEGELTYVAKAGDQVLVTEAIAPPFLYSRERTQGEEEYVLGEYLEPDVVYCALKLKGTPGRRSTVHAAQPYRPSWLVSGLSGAGKLFTPIVALIVVAVLFLGWGSTLLVARFDQSVFRTSVSSKPFTVEHPDKLLELSMHAPLRNAWAAFDILVLNGEKEIFSMAKQISYYSGVDGGESWSEGSERASAYFKVPEAGSYKLVIRGQGGRGSSSKAPPRANLTVTIKEGIIVSRYFVVLLVLCAFAFGLKYLGQWRFEAKRWGETEDD